MKTILNLVAICMTVAIIGCSSTTSTVSPGAVSECGAKDGMACTKDASECCGADKCAGEAASMAAVSECEGKSECCDKEAANMGAMSECSAKAECCKKSCDKEAASMGAMSECGAKKQCCDKKAEASLGAMSEGTCATKSSCKKSCN